MVVTSSDLEPTEVQTEATAKKDVGTAVTTDFITIDLAGLDAANVTLGSRGETKLDSRASENEEAGIVRDVETDVEIDGNIHEMLDNLGSKSAFKSAVLGVKERIIQTRSDTDKIGDRKVVRNSSVCAVHSYFDSIQSFKSDLVTSVKITSAHRHLGERVGGKGHHDHSRHKSNDSFHFHSCF